MSKQRIADVARLADEIYDFLKEIEDDYGRIDNKGFIAKNLSDKLYEQGYRPPEEKE